MFIARVSFSIPSAQAADFQKAAASVAETMLAMPGCSLAQFYRSLGSDVDVTLYQEWRSPEDFRAYAESSVFAENGRRLKPFIASAPRTARFSASPIGA